ncbi:TetR/AcrR family transcriptional regulator [Nocardia neocaledoniensis]|uniref:TetR/AcrR family transcriptional regulator n=1 Tax=Nocardia neocaledoniensis TaxID=236511 RepID=UPI0024571370|nr:TetR/AcrR family transcriptional regulator [Nocardia neocaledoniensis]
MTVQQPRRTQAERRATTRALILTNAAECLLERGYAATTVTAVQERAGLARGTVQHHFPTRTELLIAATTRVVDLRLAAFTHAAERLPTGSDRLQAVVDLAWRDLTSPAFYTALDLWVAARTDTDLRDNLIHEERRVLTEMRTRYRAMIDEPYDTDPRAETLVEFTLDLLTGLSMTAMLTGTVGDHDAVVARWKRALAVLVGRLPADELLADTAVRP